jgi:hypothetical protein
MSKAQKGNKENKKPKADKNQAKSNVSAYKVAQGQGKPSTNPFARKTWLEFVCKIECVIIAHSARRGVGSAVKVLRQAEARLLASRGRLAQVGTVIFARAAWLNLDRASLVDAADLEEARACSARKALLGAVAPAVQREAEEDCGKRRRVGEPTKDKAKRLRGRVIGRFLGRLT